MACRSYVVFPLIWWLLVGPSPFFLYVDQPSEEGEVGGETTIKKQVCGPHAERIVRGRSPRGTVLSNGICAIHFAWECGRGGAENNLQSEGGGRLEEVKIRGSSQGSAFQSHIDSISSDMTDLQRKGGLCFVFLCMEKHNKKLIC